MKNSKEVISSIDYVDNYEKGSIPNIAFQEHGTIKAHEMTTKLRKSQNSNFDSIKKEAKAIIPYLEHLP